MLRREDTLGTETLTDERQGMPFRNASIQRPQLETYFVGLLGDFGCRDFRSWCPIADNDSLNFIFGYGEGRSENSMLGFSPLEPVGFRR